VNKLKILIIRLSSLGDIILTQPIVKSLHEAYPEAEIHFLTKEQYQDIPKHFGIPLKVITYQKTLEFHLELYKAKYDYVFDLQDKLNSCLVKMACLNAKTFTYDKQHLLRKAIILHQTKQEIKSTLDLYQTALNKASHHLDRLSLSKTQSFPKLFTDKSEVERITKLYPKPEGKKVIALFPGATHFTKMYPAERFIKLIKDAPVDYHFWLLGSSQESNLCGTINTMTKEKSANLSGKLSLSELISIVETADAVISNDSGPMHIAAALGKHQIALFGATHPKLGFKPNNENAIVICKDIECQPCSLHGGETCPQKHFACMLSIETEEVLEQLLTF
jgi:lipopolysaccharide heptosyltransferase II